MLAIQNHPAFWLRVEEWDKIWDKNNQNGIELFASWESELRATYFGMLLMLPERTMLAVLRPEALTEWTPVKLAIAVGLTERFVVHRHFLPDVRKQGLEALQYHIANDNVGVKGLAMVCALAPQLLCKDPLCSRLSPK